MADQSAWRESRKSVGVPQAWLAKHTGIYRTRLSEWERGRLDLSSDELKSVKEALSRAVTERANTGALEWPKSDTDVSEGRLLARRRREWGITQAELAKHCGLTEDVISLVENGYGNLDKDESAAVDAALSKLINARGARAKMPGMSLASLAHSMEAHQGFDEKSRREARINLQKGEIEALREQIASLKGQVAAKDQEITALRDLLDLKTKEVLLRDQLEGSADSAEVPVAKPNLEVE